MKNEYLYVTDRNLTRFDVKDSLISKEVESIQDKEMAISRKPWTASTQPGTINCSQVFQQSEYEEPTAHALWL